jgi:hypothetical protein
MSDIEDDMDPIQAMHTHGAMPDDGNDALFAVANLGFRMMLGHGIGIMKPNINHGSK